MNYKDGVACLNCYRQLYRQATGRCHSDIASRDVRRLLNLCDKCGITDVEDVKALMDSYFQTNFKGECNRLVWHFLADRVFRNLALHAGLISSIYA